MEPADQRRDDGSRKTSLLSCGNTPASERSEMSGGSFFRCGLVKMRARSLTWPRALPGITVSTKALARSDDDRARCWQSFMVPDEEEPA